jgi:hypothetical protein
MAGAAGDGPVNLTPDLDGDIDLDDYIIFAGCMAGPGSLPPECATADLDNDNDCDLDDFAAFQDAFTG